MKINRRPTSSYDDDRPIRTSGSYETGTLPSSVAARVRNNSSSTNSTPVSHHGRVGGHGGFSNSSSRVGSFTDERPLTGIGSRGSSYDERPITSTGRYNIDDRPITSKGRYDVDTAIVSAREPSSSIRTYVNPMEDRPITSTGSYATGRVPVDTRMEDIPLEDDSDGYSGASFEEDDSGDEDEITMRRNNDVR